MFRRIRFLLWLPHKNKQQLLHVCSACFLQVCCMSPSGVKSSLSSLFTTWEQQKNVRVMQWTSTQILAACAFPTEHFSVTWDQSEDIRYTLGFQPQELHRCTSGTFHWALQQGKDMRCLGRGVRFVCDLFFFANVSVFGMSSGTPVRASQYQHLLALAQYT